MYFSPYSPIRQRCSIENQETSHKDSKGLITYQLPARRNVGANNYSPAESKRKSYEIDYKRESLAKAREMYQMYFSCSLCHVERSDTSRLSKVKILNSDLKDNDK